MSNTSLSSGISPKKLYKLLGYDPFPEQALLHDSDARFKVACCGRRFGKSLSSARDLEPDFFNPNTMHWIIGPSYELAEKEFRVIWDDLLINLGLIKDKRVKRAYNKKQGNMFIELPWGARIEVKSAAKDENIVGESLNSALFSEAAKHDEETWNRFIRPALADKRGRALFPSTPEGFNWYYNLWITARNEAYHESWKFPSWKNIRVFPLGRQDPEILAVERNTSKEWFDQEYGAEFTSFVGKIYPEFNEQDHVQRHEFNPEWPNYIAFDWGFANPMAAIEFQVSPQEDIYIWREYYEKGITLQMALREMEAREQPEHYHLELTFGDAADPDAIQTVNENFAQCIGDGEAKQNWRQGVEVVKKFLKLQHDGVSFDEYERPINEKPKLFVDPSCTNVIREFGNYRTKKETGATNESNKTGAALKTDDHAMDAIRYGLMHLFELGAMYGLGETMPQDQAYTETKYDKVLTAPETGTFFTMAGGSIMDKRF